MAAGFRVSQEAVLAAIRPCGGHTAAHAGSQSGRGPGEDEQLLPGSCSPGLTAQEAARGEALLAAAKAKGSFASPSC